MVEMKILRSIQNKKLPERIRNVENRLVNNAEMNNPGGKRSQEGPLKIRRDC